MSRYKIAIVGATGLVGRTFLRVIEEIKPRNCEYTLLASERTAGKKLDFLNNQYTVELLTKQSMTKGFDIALFSAGSDVSRNFAPLAAESGCVVIDNSATWRMSDEVPLVVPEVNPEDAFHNNGIIANPNCSTIQAVVALAPIHRKYGIKRIIYSTYQSVAGAGAAGVEDLENGIKAHVTGAQYSLKKFDRAIFSNCIPFIDIPMGDGYSKEEHKMVNETRKILHDTKLNITATCVRIPVLLGHGESINAELKSEYELADIKTLLKSSPGLTVIDDADPGLFPTQLDCCGKNGVYVGRIRRDSSSSNAVNLWVVADNLRKGAATNAVQIAQLLIK